MDPVSKTKEAPPAAETGAKFATREEWLKAAAMAIRPLFDAQGAADYPKFRVSCGWPKGGRNAIGQAWTPSASGDATAELFISPALEELIGSGTGGVVDVLLHELIHAVVGSEAGHKGPFKKLAKAVGLEGKMTATYPSDALGSRLLEMVAHLGPYPHAELHNLTVPKQGTRMLKLLCPICGFTCRTTRKWLVEVGTPTCACGQRMDGPEDPSEED
jgi:hypothetical protein